MNFPRTSKEAAWVAEIRKKLKPGQTHKVIVLSAELENVRELFTPTEQALIEFKTYEEFRDKYR